jgi:hypothetical protein
LLRQQPEDLAEITLALMWSRRKQRRWKPSQDEIASFVDHVAEGGMSVYKARKLVAKMLGRNEAAVKQAHVRNKKNNP